MEITAVGTGEVSLFFKINKYVSQLSSNKPARWSSSWMKRRRASERRVANPRVTRTPHGARVRANRNEWRMWRGRRWVIVMLKLDRWITHDRRELLETIMKLLCAGLFTIRIQWDCRILLYRTDMRVNAAPIKQINHRHYCRIREFKKTRGRRMKSANDSGKEEFWKLIRPFLWHLVRVCSYHYETEN